MAMHMLQPGSRHSAPASLKTRSRPSASAWRFTSCDPGTTRTRSPGATLRPRISPAARRRSLKRPLVQLPINTTSTACPTSGSPLVGHAVDVVFIGSCTNGRLSDLRLAAGLMRGRKVAPGLRVLVVPGSQDVKRQAEAEGLDRVFKEAGAEWREPGCSMCIAMNGDQIEPGQYAVSTNNRNFEGRQGKGGRTLLASPLTAAAAAVTAVS